MTWLIYTPVADKVLQRAILVNGLVNLCGDSTSWFEINWLNEFFNLNMKTLLATCQTSIINIIDLFQCTALIVSYSINL